MHYYYYYVHGYYDIKKGSQFDFLAMQNNRSYQSFYNDGPMYHFAPPSFNRNGHIGLNFFYKNHKFHKDSWAKLAP